MKRLRYRRRTEPLTVKITASRVVIFVLCALLLAACGALAENGHTAEFRAQDRIQEHFEKVEPLPFFASSQVRKNLIEIEHAEAEGVQTTSFECPGLGCTKADPPMKTCASVGAPIPVTDELSNPEQPLRDNSEPLENGGGNVTVGEMDPDGIYQGGGEGTFVQCIGKGGAVTPAYWEGHVEVEFAPAVWNEEKGEIEDVGPPSFQFSK
jgi:hypothetical protein